MKKKSFLTFLTIILLCITTSLSSIASSSELEEYYDPYGVLYKNYGKSINFNYKYQIDSNSLNRDYTGPYIINNDINTGAVFNYERNGYFDIHMPYTYNTNGVGTTIDYVAVNNAFKSDTTGTYLYPIYTTPFFNSSSTTGQGLTTRNDQGIQTLLTYVHPTSGVRTIKVIVPKNGTVTNYLGEIEIRVCLQPNPDNTALIYEITLLNISGENITDVSIFQGAELCAGDSEASPTGKLGSSAWRSVDIDACVKGRYSGYNYGYYMSQVSFYGNNPYYNIDNGLTFYRKSGATGMCYIAPTTLRVTSGAHYPVAYTSALIDHRFDQINNYNTGYGTITNFAGIFCPVNDCPLVYEDSTTPNRSVGLSTERFSLHTNETREIRFVWVPQDTTIYINNAGTLTGINSLPGLISGTGVNTTTYIENYLRGSCTQPYKSLEELLGKSHFTYDALYCKHQNFNGTTWVEDSYKTNFSYYKRINKICLALQSDQVITETITLNKMYDSGASFGRKYTIYGSDVDTSGNPIQYVNSAAYPTIYRGNSCTGSMFVVPSGVTLVLQNLNLSGKPSATGSPVNSNEPLIKVEQNGNLILKNVHIDGVTINN